MNHTRIVTALFLAILAFSPLHSPAAGMGETPETRVIMPREPDPAGKPPEIEPQTEKIAELEAQVISRINAIRQEKDLGRLEPLPALSRIARDYSRRMSEEDFVGHVDPQGKGLDDRLLGAGMSFRTVAENIARSTNMPDPVEAAVQGWMESKGHRKNILSEEFTQTGVGIWKDGETYFFTQIFRKPQ